jgi:hypothetical protein
MNLALSNKVILFEQFIDLYYPSIFSAITRLTGLQDEQVLESLTIDVFVDLWDNSDTLFKEMRPPALIYKVLLRHVFAYLKQQDSEEQIRLLQNILLIDPTHYSDIIAGSPPANH